MNTTVTSIPVGTTATVTVPGSSANLGPGFDTLGMALGIYDVVTVEVIDDGLEVIVEGEGAGEVPLDERHLVVRAVRSGLQAAHASAPGLRVTCVNEIPQSRGLGSSASAAVAGVAAANALAGGVLTTEDLVQLSSEFEGHPDNAAASVLGGAVVSWTTTKVDYTATQYHAVPLEVHPSIRATALIPPTQASTEAVRKVLPTDISHIDARFNVSRVAVMTMAVSRYPELLIEGTRDRLHQTYRAEVLPVTAEWVNRLRNLGYAAYLSGAGPTAMVLHTTDIDEKVLDQAREAGLRVVELTVAGPVTVELTTP